jgi:hypothetical protein
VFGRIRRQIGRVFPYYTGRKRQKNCETPSSEARIRPFQTIVKLL